MKFFYLLLTLFLTVLVLSAEDLVEFDYELDAYYTNASAFIDLDIDNNITNANDYSESEIYKGLFLNSLSPNIFLMETAIHPMSLVGLYFRDRHEADYKRAKLQDTNLIKSMTAGFEEPYSVSFFVGRMMVFQKKKADRIGKNRAYIGYLLSLGNQSIKDNFSHNDRWVNFEFKLKGTREKYNKDLDWSFRLGTKLHNNSDFVDTIYIGARRKSIDYKKSVYSFIYNSAFNTMVAVDSKEFKLTEAEFVIEKTWPLSWSKKMSFGLGVGYLFHSENKYRGELKEAGIDNHQFIFRPNFKY